MIDLHIHSTFSDGSLTPEQLVRQAWELGLTAIALTDHDCIDGIAPFLDACRRYSVRGIAGVEISADVPRGTLHMLGYCIDPADSELGVVLRRIRAGRDERNRAILEKLNALGAKLDWSEVAAFAHEEVVGRPHFAQALVAKGVVESSEAAFERYLGKGKPAYVERYRLSAVDCIAVIKGAGGVPVLAHPFTLELTGTGLRDYVGELRQKGLEGIEVYYSEHTEEQTREYMALARKFDLAMTGGSDFHGEINPAIKMGRGFGSLHVPDELLPSLVARAVRRCS